MAELKIEYDNGKFVEVELEDYLFFLGGQNQWKRKLIRSLKRFSLAKKLDSLEEGVYGENGIEIYYGDKQLKSQRLELFFLEDNSSIYNQLCFTKDNLLHQELMNIQHHIEITTQIEQLNDELINLEIILNKYIREFSNSISSDLGRLEFSDILKNNLTLTYFDKNQRLPLAMMNSSELLDEYVILLREMIARKEEMVWLTIVNPESFLETKDINYLFAELKKIAVETKQLKFFVFSNSPLELNYDAEDISKTVLLYQDYQQMPVFEIFQQSIARHYPDQLTMTTQELVDRFYRIAYFIGKGIQNTFYLSPKDMVLLKVLENLLQVEFQTETSVEALTQLEDAFLKNYRVDL